MPRSGTTLVEQTLASHAAVFGAGERPELSQAIRRLRAEPFGVVYPEAVRSMTGEALRRMAAEYVAALRSPFSRLRRGSSTRHPVISFILG